jgi:AcrR family transcriptional regulator
MIDKTTDMAQGRVASDTKGRILDAAEKLVAERGMSVSLRTITGEAGVNLAAVNYHFQSKEALFDAVVERRLAPMNRRRIELLDRLEASHPAGPLPLKDVLDAFLGPMIRMGSDDAEHLRPLIGRLYSLPEEFLRRIFERHLQPIVARFDAAFARAAPHLSEVERRRRMVFSVGATIHILNWGALVAHTSPGVAMKESVLEYATGGFLAPASAEGGQS